MLFKLKRYFKHLAWDHGAIKGAFQRKYSRSSRKRPPRELEKVVVTRADRLRKCTLVSDQKLKE